MRPVPLNRPVCVPAGQAKRPWPPSRIAAARFEPRNALIFAASLFVVFGRS